jgi:hypothetical protein
VFVIDVGFLIDVSFEMIVVQACPAPILDVVVRKETTQLGWVDANSVQSHIAGAAPRRD